ncbi:MAG: hypothetical protein Q8K65_09425 [Alphaproteobacteria bacterium]|nr:hypothetical protein [Alphaproteobacteria bacterium]
MHGDRITSQDIEALVDNQLDPARAARMRRLLTRQPHLQRHYQQLVTQKQLLQHWWATLPQSSSHSS